MAQKKTDKKKKGVMIIVTLPFRLNKELIKYTEAKHLRSKAFAVVEILEMRLLPQVDGHHAS